MSRYFGAWLIHLLFFFMAEVVDISVRSSRQNTEIQLRGITQAKLFTTEIFLAMTLVGISLDDCYQMSVLSS